MRRVRVPDTPTELAAIGQGDKDTALFRKYRGEERKVTLRPADMVLENRPCQPDCHDPFLTGEGMHHAKYIGRIYI